MSNKKKILHIITVSFVINHFFGNQFNYLRKRYGNEYYLGCSPSQEFENLSSQLGYIPFKVEITRKISPWKDIMAIFAIINFIRVNKINVIVGHTPKGGMVAMIAGFLAGVQNRIYFRHGIIYETSSGFKRFLLKNIDRISGYLANQVVCVSEEVKCISERDRLNAASKNIILGNGTCNGIDTMGKFNPDSYSLDDCLKMRADMGISPCDRVVGYVGRIVKDKGINELIEAWKKIEKNHTNVKLLLLGPIESRDPIYESTKKIIESSDSIINTGFVLNSAPYFRMMDIFILPTYREGFPTVTLEASSMELPVLTTQATGCSGSIVNNITGLFIKNSPESIVLGIEKYLKDANLRKEHGKNGRKFVVDNFDQTIVWEEIHKILKY